MCSDHCCDMRLPQQFVTKVTAALSVLIGRSYTGFPKEKQQHSLVKVELKVVGKHSTGDVRETRTDEQCCSVRNFICAHVPYPQLSKGEA